VLQCVVVRCILLECVAACYRYPSAEHEHELVRIARILAAVPLACLFCVIWGGVGGGFQNATPYNTLQHAPTHIKVEAHCHTVQHSATQCNTPQHTATHCNTLQRTATHCNALQHTATHCNTGNLLGMCDGGSSVVVCPDLYECTRACLCVCMHACVCVM